MNELAVHPNIYATGRSRGLIAMLERIWIREHTIGDGTLYIVSGFANYNGGVRFFPFFRRHVSEGGKIIAIFAGSSNQRLTSRQIVAEMLECGAEVHVVNRKRLMHMKSYGRKSQECELLIVTSGNFTGPGMSQNVEMSVLLDHPTTRDLSFSWDDLTSSILKQPWNMHEPTLDDQSSPAWQLLYDEQASTVTLDETDEVTLILRLGHPDTIRINALPGTRASRGSQYFWLSRDCYDFFPALTIPNTRGIKRTFSCMINMNFIDIQFRDDVRVTFEAENNLDFRLGTGPLRYTGLAESGDIAAISRIAEDRYELRIFRQGTPVGSALDNYAIHFIGNRGKRYGFISNQQLGQTIGTTVG